MERNLTQLSAQEHARLGSGQMSTALVAQYLRDGHMLRCHRMEEEVR